jgi:hypothetical protein
MDTVVAEQNTSSLEQACRIAEGLKPVDQAKLLAWLANKVAKAVEQPAGESPSPRKSLHGALAHLGPMPSMEEIKELRREVWANFPRE